MDVSSQHGIIDSLRKKKGTEEYSTTAEVTRIDGDDIYVRIPGSEAETCVENSSANVSVGDTVDITVSNYDTHITGNRTDKAAGAKAVEAVNSKVSIIGSIVKTINSTVSVINSSIEVINSRIRVKDNVLEFLDHLGDVIASYGATATIGKTTEENVVIGNSSLDFRYGDDSVANFWCERDDGNEITEAAFTLADDGLTIEAVNSSSDWGRSGAELRSEYLELNTGYSGTNARLSLTNGNAGLGTIADDAAIKMQVGSTSCKFNRGIFSSETVNGGTWIQATKKASFAVPESTRAASNSFAQGFLSAKVSSGAWSMSGLSGSNDLYFAFGTDANYNSGTNTTTKTTLHSDGTIQLTPSLAITAHQLVSTGTTIKAGSSLSGTSSALTKSGWYPLGIVGWSTSTWRVSPTRLYVNKSSGSCTVTYTLGNTSSADTSSAGLNVDILWCRA